MEWDEGAEGSVSLAILLNLLLDHFAGFGDQENTLDLENILYHLELLGVSINCSTVL